ncbi:hypothetical protein D3C80_980410 [compost metagenome]
MAGAAPGRLRRSGVAAGARSGGVWAGLCHAPAPARALRSPPLGAAARRAAGRARWPVLRLPRQRFRYPGRTGCRRRAAGQRGALPRAGRAVAGGGLRAARRPLRVRQSAHGRVVRLPARRAGCPFAAGSGQRGRPRAGLRHAREARARRAGVGALRVPRADPRWPRVHGRGLWHAHRTGWPAGDHRHPAGRDPALQGPRNRPGGGGCRGGQPDGHAAPSGPDRLAAAVCFGKRRALGLLGGEAARRRTLVHHADPYRRSAPGAGRSGAQHSRAAPGVRPRIPHPHRRRQLYLDRGLYPRASRCQR